MKLTPEQIERAKRDYIKAIGYDPFQPQYQTAPDFTKNIYEKAAFDFWLAAVAYYQPQSIFSEKEGIDYPC